MGRSYADAIKALNTLQSNYSIVEAFRKDGFQKNKTAIPEMIEWARKIGYEKSDLDALNVVHVAGTKGKGSTSAFLSFILTQYAAESQSRLPKKVGLYTSPHLRFVRERTQINNEMLSEEKFTKYFFEVWDRLENAAEAKGLEKDTPEVKPMYFRFLTLMAFHVFLSEGVDTTILECGIGGEYDTTNIIDHPMTTAITSLGIDHVEILGGTLPEIAWHKAGIFKAGVQAFVSPQPEDAVRVLEQRAAEKNCPITFVDRHPEINSIKLGLASDFQKTNASLAITLAAAQLQALKQDQVPGPLEIAASPLPAAFRRGLELARWPGRFETRHDTRSNVTWHIDGAHTLESIELAGRWYAGELDSTDDVPRILVFNQQKRDAEALAKSLYETLASALKQSINTEIWSPFTHVIFCTNVTFREAGYRPDLVSMNTSEKEVGNLTVQNKLAATWRSLDPASQVEVVSTIEEAIDRCRQIAEGSVKASTERASVLVTGSLHLVGGAIDVLETK